MNALVVACVFAALMYIGDLILRRAALKGLQCRRAFSQPAAFEGREVELVEVVRNDGPFLIPWLRVESRISPCLRFGRRENLDVKGEMYHKSVFMLMPYQQVTRRHLVRLAKRGAYDAGNATLTAGGLIDLGCASREQRMSAPILVYPRLMEDEELPPPVFRLLGQARARRQLLQDPFLTRGIRSYQPGDNVRDIHWPATARTGQAQVRVREPAAQGRLMVVLNAQMTQEQWGNLMDYEQGTIEYAISLAATACVQALRAGLPAGFAANMPMGEDKACAVLPPASGAAREETLLAAFARLRVVFCRDFLAFLEDLTFFSGMDFLIISAYDSLEIQARLHALSLKGNTAEMVLLEAGRGAAHGG